MTMNHPFSTKVLAALLWIIWLPLVIVSSSQSSQRFHLHAHSTTSQQDLQVEDPFTDSAKWIWGPSAAADVTTTKGDPGSNTWMLFQKTVALTKAEVESLSIVDDIISTSTTSILWKAKIAVDSKYWLWMSWKEEGEQNNKCSQEYLDLSSDNLVVREGGLKRGPTPHDTWYDPITVTVPPPPPNKNSNGTLCFQVLVWYWGKNGYSHKSSGHGGLLLDSSLIINSGINTNTARDIHIVSDSSWSAQVHPAFQSHPKEHRPYQDTPNYRLSESNIYYDARRSGPSQLAARELGPAGSAPWNQLYPRTIPYWKDHALQDYKTVHYDTENNSNNTQVILARVANNTQFFPFIQFSSPDTPAGIRVEIQTDNYQYPHRFDDPTYLRTTYITRRGVQTFESPAWINGHVVTYSIFYPNNHNHNSTRPVVQYRPTQYNTILTGSFHCNDDFYNQLWDKARRTLLVNMRDSFMDCPDRERAQWWGDVSVDIGQVGYSMDQSANALMQKAIVDLVRWQSPPDNTPSHCPKLHAPVPSGDNTELPIQMLSSIGWYGFYTYWQLTGDNATIQQAYPVVQQYLQHCWSLDSVTGLVEHRKGDWDWEDWGINIDAPLMDNAWYVLALRAAIPMAKLAGYPDDVDLWQQQISSIETNFDATFWSGDAYKSSKLLRKFLPPDDRGNAMAVLAGLVPTTSDRSSKLAQVLTQQFWASPYMEKYVLEALFVLQEPDLALQRMKQRYKEMVLKPDLTTLWEQWELKSGTYNHAWSGGPLTLLSQYVVGIAPTSPGWKTFHVFPQEGSELTEIQATVPIISGGKDEVIEVSITKTDVNSGEEGQFSIFLSFPRGLRATIGVPKRFKFEKLHCCLHTVNINNSTAWRSGGGAINGPSMGKEIRFDGEHGSYVRWTALTGRWDFEGRGDCTSAEALVEEFKGLTSDQQV